MKEFEFLATEIMKKQMAFLDDLAELLKKHDCDMCTDIDPYDKNQEAIGIRVDFNPHQYTASIDFGWAVFEHQIAEKKAEIMKAHEKWLIEYHEKQKEQLI